MIGTEEPRRRGSPLAVLGLLLVAWIGGRVLLWESPFAANPLNLPESVNLLADADIPSQPGSVQFERSTIDADAVSSDPFVGGEGFLAFGNDGSTGSGPGTHVVWSDSPFAVNPQVAAGHQLLWAAALAHMPMPRAVENALRADSSRIVNAVSPQNDNPPFAAQILPAGEGRLETWSLDAWAFWREGSNAAPISQGRVPIYGASQVGASLRYRFAPDSPLDPLLYGRAYRALVSNGETEVAAGVAVRPIESLPVRAFAELRYTDNAFGNEVRPAAFAVTELPPVKLPVGLKAEAYAQAGYVGGDDPTPFADGQVIVSRKLAEFDLASVAPARLSVGAGAWGGAQEDATRLDLGPTIRLDLTIGQVPARISVDWREQVAGDAAPASGVAATLSTRF